MIAWSVVIVGRADVGWIVQTPVAALNPGSVCGMSKLIVLMIPIDPLTCACCAGVSELKPRVRFDSSIACRSESVCVGLLSAVVLTVIVAGRRRPSAASIRLSRTAFRFRTLEPRRKSRRSALSISSDRA